MRRTLRDSQAAHMCIAKRPGYVEAITDFYQLKQNTVGIHLHDFFLLLPKTSRPKQLSISRIDGSALGDGTYWCLFELPSSQNGIRQPAHLVLR